MIRLQHYLTSFDVLTNIESSLILSEGGAAMNNEKMVMTVRIDKKVAERFNSLIEDIGLRRDTYLNRVLPQEVDLLSRLPPHSERATRFSKLSERIFEEQKTRLSLKLDSALVQRINDVCREKGLVRDAFIETFLSFLVDGTEGDSNLDFVPSPLGQIWQLINDPHYENRADNLNIYKPLHIEDSVFDDSGHSFFRDVLKAGLGNSRKTRGDKEEA
jgi:antitoxin component of RelBE/YafQ-DinJ toxin-antitoxin module